MVTENGIGTQSGQKSIRYFREHIAQMRRAMNDGVDVRGYFPWTPVDNYEWTYGWDVQFGLFDRDRQPRGSAEAVAEWIAADQPRPR